MKVLHLNTYDTGGAAKAMLRLHRGLLEAGVQSHVLVFKKTQEDATVSEVQFPFLVKWFYRLRSELNFRLLKKRTDPIYNFFNAGEDVCIDAKYLLKSLPFQPDVVMLHWVTGYVTSVNLRDFYQAVQVPILWRFNDLNAFTGGCHYTKTCLRYHEGCGQCPALRSNQLEDLSYKNLQLRKQLLKTIPLSFVSSTSEIDQQVRSSALGKQQAVNKILISADIELFQPAADKKVLRQSLQLPEDKFIIFFGCQHILDPRKGFDRLLHNLKQLHERLTPAEREKVLLVYASRYSEVSPDIFPFTAQQLPFANTEQALAQYYQLADLFISPSIEDAGPMMILESLLCGTPVIAYNIGLAPDAIQHAQNGFIYPLNGPGDLSDGMLELIRASAEDYQAFCRNARTFAAGHFSHKREVQAYLDLFQKITNKHV